MLMDNFGIQVESQLESGLVPHADPLIFYLVWCVVKPT